MLLIYLLFIKVVFCAVLFSSIGEAAQCVNGKRPLFFAIDQKVGEILPSSFSADLYSELDVPLQEIGYCITRYTPAVLSDSLLQDEIILMLSLKLNIISRTIEVSDSAAGGDSIETVKSVQVDTSADVVLSTISVGRWSSTERKMALTNPLISQTYTPKDIATFQSVLIKKIVENLRMQYICHLRIESVPDGVAIRANHGLEGTTPLEWIIPVGNLPITGTLEGYEPIKRKINLAAPGNHTYVLQMERRRFYHSGFFVPAVVCATSSAASFVLMEYFDRKYDALTREPRQPNGPQPDEAPFAQAYNRAVACEVAGFSLLGLAAGSFTLCFFF